MKKGAGIVLGIIIACLILLGLFIYLDQGRNIINLPSSEINEYNGTRLDSINDFRENSIKGVQYINITKYSLRVEGLVENQRKYSYDEILLHQNYKKVVTLNCVEGWSAKILWEGILLQELFDEAKPLPEASVIIFHAYDGYTVTYPIDYFLDRKIIMAYKMNDLTIPPERGFPFVLVAEDKWGYKWIKWITEIEFSDNENYRGYWESKGYSKEGDLNESFLE